MIPQVLSQASSAAQIRFPLAKAEASSAIWNIWTDSLVHQRAFRPVSGPKSAKSDGAVALCSLSKDAKSKEFREIEVEGRSEELLIAVDASGRLTSANYDEQFWIRKFNISQDTHSNSALLEITADHKLCLRIVKNVSPNEELLLWFSENVLAEMNIPFLTPSNIQGEDLKWTDEAFFFQKSKVN